MGAVVPFIPLIAGVIGGGASIYAASKTASAAKAAAKASGPLPTMTPRANSAVSDAIMSRRGSAENRRTGTAGAESSTTGKKSLLGQ